MAGSPHSSGRPADAGCRALPLLSESASPVHSQGKPDVRTKGTAFPASWPPPQDPPQLPAPSLKNRASALEHSQGQRKQREVFVSGHSLLAELRRQPHLCSAGHTGCRRLSLEGSSLVLSLPKFLAEAQGGPNQVSGLAQKVWIELCARPGTRRLCFSWNPLNMTAAFGSWPLMGHRLNTKASSSPLCQVPMKCKHRWACPSGNRLWVWLWAGL